jgi:putative membrane protein
VRPIPLYLGVLTLAIAWSGPVLDTAGHAFFAHMVVHMSVVAVAAPLLAFGIAGSAWDPVRYTPAPFSALAASFIELAVVWAWHTPALHGAARQNTSALVAEQGSFLLSGLFLWIAVFGGEPDDRRNRGATGIVALLLTVMHMTLLGALLALSPRPLYGHLHGYPGLTPLEDQHLGGAIMLIVGGVSYLAGGLWLSIELLREPEKAV